MVGTRRLELLTSTVSRLTSAWRLPKYTQVVQDIAFCGLGCGLGKRAKLPSILSLYQFPILTNGHARYWLQRHRQIVTRMSEFPCPDERTLLRKVHEVAGRCCRRSPSDGAVLAGAKAALETVWAFFEHAQQCLLLPVVDLTFQQIGR